MALSSTTTNHRLPAKIRLRQMGGRLAFAIRGGDDGDRTVRVLNYHEITDEQVAGDWDQMTTPKALFAEQMEWLRGAGYRVIDAHEAVELVAGTRPWPTEPVVVLTFDDGFRNYLTNAWPVLERHGFPSTLFIPTHLVGQHNGRLDWSDIHHLARSGLVSYGSHSATHKKLRRLPVETVQRELQDSKRCLEERLQRPVTLFAYPYGSYDAFDGSTIEALKATGFRGAFTTIAGANRPGTDPFRLRRTRISWVDGPAEFRMTLAGAFDWYAGYQWVTGWHG